jgi:hypothetical protein
MNCASAQNRLLHCAIERLMPTAVAAACAAYKLVRAHAGLLTPGFTKIILKL